MLWRQMSKDPVFSFPENLPDPGIKLGSSALQAESLPSEPPGKPQAKSQTLLLSPLTYAVLLIHR